MISYKVQKGDSLWGIAKKLLGDGNKYREIQKASGLNTTVIHPGMVLKIPSSNSSGTDYDGIGRAFEKAINDVENLESVKNLYNMIGE